MGAEELRSKSEEATPETLIPEIWDEVKFKGRFPWPSQAIARKVPLSSPNPAPEAPTKVPV
jgi:hypothetical protein